MKSEGVCVCVCCHCSLVCSRGTDPLNHWTTRLPAPPTTDPGDGGLYYMTSVPEIVHTLRWRISDGPDITYYSGYGFCLQRECEGWALQAVSGHSFLLWLSDETVGLLVVRSHGNHVNKEAWSQSWADPRASKIPVNTINYAINRIVIFNFKNITSMGISVCEHHTGSAPPVKTKTGTPLSS